MESVDEECWGVTESYLQNCSHVIYDRLTFVDKLIYFIFFRPRTELPRIPHVRELDEKGNLLFFKFSNKGDAFTYFHHMLAMSSPEDTERGLKCYSTPILFCLSNRKQYHSVKLMSTYMEQTKHNKRKKGVLDILKGSIKDYDYKYMMRYDGTLIRC